MGTEVSSLGVEGKSVIVTIPNNNKNTLGDFIDSSDTESPDQPESSDQPESPD